MALPKMKQPNDTNFEKMILRQSTPALVCFWASWSGPSKLLSPLLAEIAESHNNKFIVGMIDVDESPMIAAIYGIRTLPTFLVFKNGEVMERLQGASNRKTIEELFEKL